MRTHSRRSCCHRWFWMSVWCLRALRGGKWYKSVVVVVGRKQFSRIRGVLDGFGGTRVDNEFGYMHDWVRLWLNVKVQPPSLWHLHAEEGNRVTDWTMSNTAMLWTAWENLQDILLLLTSSAEDHRTCKHIWIHCTDVVFKLLEW